MQRILLASILKIELPAGTVRLVDGGSLTVAGEAYRVRDALLGAPAGIEALTEGVGDEAPALMLSFVPPGNVPAATLINPANQNARLRLWNVEVDADSGLPIGDPDQAADMILDVPAIVLTRGGRTLEMTFVSGGDRLFQVQRGNSLSPTFHRGIYPGEAGLDNASGVSTSVAWGAPSAPRGVGAAGSGSSIRGSGLFGNVGAFG